MDDAAVFTAASGDILVENNSDGRQQTLCARQIHETEGAHGFSEKGMDADRQVYQRMDNGVPEGSQRVIGKAVSNSSTNLLRSCTTELGRSGGPADITEIGKEGQAIATCNVRPLRRKPGQGHPAWGWMDVPP